jgi:hypothetical protein
MRLGSVGRPEEAGARPVEAYSGGDEESLWKS